MRLWFRQEKWKVRGSMIKPFSKTVQQVSIRLISSKTIPNEPLRNFLSAL